MARILFVGPLPPPVGGFSLVTETMAKRFATLPTSSLTVFDMSPHKQWRLPSKVMHFAWICILAKLQNERVTVYVALSGGVRQLIDCLFILLARVLGYQTLVHHHSFGYLNNPTWICSLAMRLGKRAKHLVLCRDMGELLAATYQIDKVHVLSNAFMVEVESTNKSNDDESRFVLGFISNITEEKGIFDFLDFVEHANSLVKEVWIAGPVDPAIEARFKAAISKPNVRYLGPVYGEEKKEFFKGVDVLVFPTKYRNEAEPVVLLEAMRSGIPIVARSRGCIACTAGNAGVVVSTMAELNTQGLAYLNSLTLPGAYAAERNRIRAHFDALRQESEASLTTIVSDC